MRVLYRLRILVFLNRKLKWKCSTWPCSSPFAKFYSNVPQEKIISMNSNTLIQPCHSHQLMRMTPLSCSDKSRRKKRWHRSHINTSCLESRFTVILEHDIFRNNGPFGSLAHVLLTESFLMLHALLYLGLGLLWVEIVSQARTRS